MGGLVSAAGDLFSGNIGGAIENAAGAAIDYATGLPISSVVNAAGQLGGAAIGANGAQQAANTQLQGTNASIAAQMAMFNKTQQNLQPYMDLGTKATSALTNATGLDTDNPLTSDLLKPITMDQATLEQTPGYQFNLAQGLKATQNAAAARGLGVSGAALKGASTYATGLADSTYQNQFNNALTNQTNQFNRLSDLSGAGQNAAAGLGAIGQKTGGQLGSTVQGGANSQAASQIASNNALAKGITGAANTLGTAGLYGNNNAITNAGNYNPGNEESIDYEYDNPYEF